MPCFRAEISFVNKAKLSLCSGLLKGNLNEVDGVESKWNWNIYFFAAPNQAPIIQHCENFRPPPPNDDADYRAFSGNAHNVGGHVKSAR